MGYKGQVYGADTSRFNTLTNANTQRYGYDTQAETSRYGTDANLFGNIYNANAGMVNNMNNNDTARYSSDQNFYTAQRGQDLTQMTAGANLLNSGVDGAVKAGQGVYNVGNTTMQAPATMMTNYNNIMQPVLNTTGTGTTTAQGSQVAGATGGAIVGNQIAQQVSNNLGFNGSNWSTGTGYERYINPDYGIYF
jgi:hypothetical protein